MRVRTIHVEGTGAPALDVAERALRRDFDDGYTLDGGDVRFESIGGSVPAFSVEPHVVGDAWTLEIRIDDVERDYGAAAVVAETLAREHGGRAVDPILPHPLWPPYGGGPEHPVESVCEAEWTFDDPRALGAALLAAADEHWPSAIPFAYSESEPFACEAEPGDRRALATFLQAPTSGNKSAAWLCRRPALYGLASWRSTRASLTVGILEDAIEASRAAAGRFFDVLSRATGSEPTTKSCRVTVERGSWWVCERSST